MPYVEGIEINPYAYDKASEVLDLTWMQSAENQHLFVSREETGSLTWSCSRISSSTCANHGTF